MLRQASATIVKARGGIGSDSESAMTSVALERGRDYGCIWGTHGKARMRRCTCDSLCPLSFYSRLTFHSRPSIFRYSTP